MSNGVTIGQAAAFVGVTVKTVRHYHELGVVAEPERDSSGYRRYGSVELLQLVQVRTLAAAGVPLAEIGPLLDADATRFGRISVAVRAAAVVGRSHPIRSRAPKRAHCGQNRSHQQDSPLRHAEPSARADGRVTFGHGTQG
ncbi:MerR family transcriptional regulator [Kitasatospora sp. NBC_00240]|uniref:MerR family transcriptional regulator n=1 Tax=Kitasatospora sp. NBC_00240 TaxID=2903567 RepID=UPI002B1DBE90|nr:MerR family transcriptional regulator [Kitasatospora sp. NBC_00240]